MQGRFKNTLKLTKFYFKREWLPALIWIAIIVAMSILVAVIFTDLYGTPEERLGMAETMSNPAMVAMVGPVFGIDSYTDGMMYAQMMLLFSIMAIAVMNIFLVVRHTRRDEENGRIELIRSLPVGRLSNLGSTMIVCATVNLAMALILGLGLALLNIESMDFAGCILYGAIMGISGLFFGSVTAVFAQISSTARGAVSFALIYMGADYLIRAIGDVGGNFLSYISPLGMSLRTQIFYTNDWWPVIVLAILSLILIGVALYLNSIRDLGAGLVAAKLGRSTAKKSLLSTTGLTLRLLRPAITGWAVVVIMMGVSYGSIFGDIETFLGDSELLQQVFLNNDKFTFAEQFMTTLVIISAVLVTVPTLIFMLRIRAEEKQGRLENIYAMKISRTKVFTNYLVVALIGSIVLAFLFGATLWVASAASMDDPIAFTTMISAVLSFVPAIWVMVGGATLLIGFLPKFSNLIWAFLGAFFFVIYIGRLLGMPEWLIEATPFGAVPQIPVEDFNIIPLLILTAIAAVMIAVSYIGYRRRDINAK